MTAYYSNILKSISRGAKLLAVLIDPDKMKLEDVSEFTTKLNNSIATHIFVGGSTVADNATQHLISELKKFTSLPLILFPGDVTQISDKADAVLFLSLISGRQSDYLIGKHVKAVSKLRGTNLEVIPTGYVLVDGGKESAVQRVTNSNPIERNNKQQIVDTAVAGELLGMKLIYLEAGSGALFPIPKAIISEVKKELSIPLIVGGGIRSKQHIKEAYNAGADLVVIGTAFEDDATFFNKLV